MDKQAMEVGYELVPVVKRISRKTIYEYSARYGGILLKTLHTSKEIANKSGFKDVLLQGSQALNYASEMLFKTYREHWITNSFIEGKFIKSVFPGDILTIRGMVKEKKIEAATTNLKLDIWSEDKFGDMTMLGKARVKIKEK